MTIEEAVRPFLDTSDTMDEIRAWSKRTGLSVSVHRTPAGLYAVSNWTGDWDMRRLANTSIGRQMLEDGWPDDAPVLTEFGSFLSTAWTAFQARYVALRLTGVLRENP